MFGDNKKEWSSDKKIVKARLGSQEEILPTKGIAYKDRLFSSELELSLFQLLEGISYLSFDWKVEVDLFKGMQANRSKMLFHKKLKPINVTVDFKFKFKYKTYYLFVYKGRDHVRDLLMNLLVRKLSNTNQSHKTKILVIGKNDFDVFAERFKAIRSGELDEIL